MKAQNPRRQPNSDPFRAVEGCLAGNEVPDLLANLKPKEQIADMDNSKDEKPPKTHPWDSDIDSDPFKEAGR